MATNIEEIVRNLTGFYGFAGKTVIVVGAGGGQLVEYTREARRVIAVDRDPIAIEGLTKRLDECGLTDRFTVVHSDLLTVQTSGDVVVFEFCLHEMKDPEQALRHAGQLARDVIVIDHAPGSRWMFYAAEEDGVEAAWSALGRRAIRRRLDVEGGQRFHDYAELAAKMAQQGPKSLERIRPYQGQEGIAIPMPYRLALI
jgi:predicted RNA methylase